MKKFLRKLFINNKELLLGIIVGFILSGTAVFGLILYSSSNVFYKNTDSHLSSTKVQAAIDEIYRKCTTTAYTLTYDTNGGNACDPSSKTVIFNGTYGTLCTPTRTGYTFDGWFTQASGGTQVTSSTVYKKGGDSTIHAHWTPNTYSIGYELNGGSYGSSHPTSGTYDNVLTINNPTKTVTVTGDVNSTGATISSSTSGNQTFAGWTYSNGTTSTAKYGTTSTNVNTSWSSGSTKVTAEYFKNLRSSSGTVTLTANWTPVAFNLPTVSKDGYTCKWNTEADGSGTDYGSGESYTPTADSSSSVTLYAQCSGNTYTSTFYYQSNVSSGSTTVSNKTEECTVTSGNSCTVNIPSEVTNSGGTYNNKYAGLSTSTGNMTEAVSSSATSVTLTSDKNYYSLYRTKITMAYPTSTTVATTKDTYQNQWFTSNSAMATTVLSTTTTGTTSNATIGTLVSGYSLVGFSDTPNGMVVVPNISTLTQSNSNKSATRTVYQTEKDEDTETITFYYQTSSTNGTCSVGSKTKTGTTTTTLGCSSTTEAVGLFEFENITVPTEVTNSVGQYNNAYAGVSSSLGSMAATPEEDIDTSTLTYYAIYRTPVTNYYWDGSKYTSRTLYRNMAISSSSTCGTTYLSSISGSLSNYITSRGPGSSAWAGLSTGNDTTPEYTTVAEAAQSTSTTLYTVYQFNVTFSPGSNVSSVGSTSGSCKIASSETANATTPDSCSVTLPSITPNSGYTSIGWNITNGATTGTEAGQSYTINYNPRTLYANAYPSVTYNAGSTCTGATGMPTTQAKIPDVNLTLQSGEPTCSGKEFLGWSTTSNATASSTWYDGGSSYSGSGGLTLYAQFYDVSDLEDSYTTAVQSGDFGDFSDFSAVTVSDFTITKDSSGSNVWAYTATNSPFPTQEGYVVKGVSGFSVSNTAYRPYGIDQNSIKVRDMGNRSDTVAPSASIFSKQYLSVKSRTAESFSNNTIDERIDRLQKIQDVSLTYDDIKTENVITDNITVDGSKNLTVQLCEEKSEWQPVSLAGNVLSNATTNGTYTSRTVLTKLYKTNVNSTPGLADSAAVTLKVYANPSTTPKVKLNLYYIVVRNKTARSTTFTANTLSTQGASRYAALEALNSDRSDYFPESYIKRYTRVEGETANIAAWGTGTVTANLSIPDGKLLGSFGHGVTNGSSSSANGSSYSMINKNWVEGINTTSGIYHMLFYAGNQYASDTAGHAQTSVFGWGHLFYVSSGTLTVS